MTVENINGVPNQFRIRTDKGFIFQSYGSNIVVIENGEVFLDNLYWNYSRTTSKYRSIFLGETTTVTKSKIKSGEYKLKNLN